MMNLNNQFDMNDAINYLDQLKFNITNSKDFSNRENYQSMSFSKASRFIEKNKNNIYTDLSNIAFRVRMCDFKHDKKKNEIMNHESAARWTKKEIWEEVDYISNIINKLDDIMSYFIYIYNDESQNCDSSNVWQNGSSLSFKLRHLYTIIEDSVFYINSRMKCAIEKVHFDGVFNKVFNKYPEQYNFDVITADTWGGPLSLHKVETFEDAQSFIDFYYKEYNEMIVIMREASPYTPEILTPTHQVISNRRKSYSTEFKKMVYEYQDKKCGCCKDKVPMKKMHLDHITPLSIGGLDVQSNMQFLCQECNLTKSWKPMHNAQLYEKVMKKRLSKKYLKAA